MSSTTMSKASTPAPTPPSSSLNMLGVTGLTADQVALFDEMLSTSPAYLQQQTSSSSSPTHQHPSPTNSNGVEGILSQHWRPCTGDLLIGEYMDCLQFPVSYRVLCHRWKDLGKPRLQNLRTPLSLRFGAGKRTLNSYRENMNLQDVTEAQEGAIVRSIEEFFERGFASQAKLFVGFASHLDVYSAVHAELSALEQGLDVESQMQLYQATWKNLLEAFEIDRSICSARYQHECIGHLLWGELYAWPAQEIHRRFSAYQRRSSTVAQRRSNIPLPALDASLSSLMHTASAPTSPFHSTLPSAFNTPTTGGASALYGMFSPTMSDADGMSSTLSPFTPTTDYFPTPTFDSWTEAITAPSSSSSLPATSSSSACQPSTPIWESDALHPKTDLNDAMSLLRSLQMTSSSPSTLAPSKSAPELTPLIETQFTSTSAASSMDHYSTMLQEAASLLDATAKRLGAEATQLQVRRNRRSNTINDDVPRSDSSTAASSPSISRQRSHTVGVDCTAPAL